MQKIRVLIIDDSALIRRMLTDILSSDSDIEVVGTAMDPTIARRKIKDLNPDVITLDIEMPKMDGISFLRKLMRLRPMPVIMISSLTEKSADVTLEALSLGAIDVVSKPKLDIANEFSKYAEEIIEKVKNASTAKVKPRLAKDTVAKKKETLSQTEDVLTDVDSKFSATVVLQRSAHIRTHKTTDKIIAIGASTGGTEAIKDVMVDLPPDTPAVLITQHIPPVFSASFAARVNSLSAMTVVEATDGQLILPGHAYVAPGDKHLLLSRDGASYRCKLHDGLPVNRHKPSVDVLFRSVAENAGKNSVGVILTGMGADGARGLKEMLEAGAKTIAQDEKTSVVWGMPGEAVKLGAANQVLGLQHISAEILNFCRESND